MSQTLDEAVGKLVAEAVVEGDCLITLRSPSANRPQVKVDGRAVTGYVAVWMLANGLVPDGCQIHHRCLRARCVLEEHLICLSEEDHQEIHRQHIYLTVERCVEGHPLSGSNLSIHAARPTWRKCKTCARDATARLRLRQRGGVPATGTFPAPKLTADQRDEVRRRYRAGGIRQVDLAAEYGVTQTTISKVILK